MKVAALKLEVCNTHDEDKNYRYEMVNRTPEQKR
jgi:hypothetical protein